MWYMWLLGQDDWSTNVEKDDFKPYLMTVFYSVVRELSFIQKMKEGARKWRISITIIAAVDILYSPGLEVQGALKELASFTVMEIVASCSYRRKLQYLTVRNHLSVVIIMNSKAKGAIRTKTDNLGRKVPNTVCFGSQ